MATFDPELDPHMARWERVVADIEMEVHTGLLTAGDKLPAEGLLSERYGFTRSTVRRALAELRNQGLIEIRLPGGHYVSESSSLPAV